MISLCIRVNLCGDGKSPRDKESVSVRYVTDVTCPSNIDLNSELIDYAKAGKLLVVRRFFRCR